MKRWKLLYNTNRGKSKDGFLYRAGLWYDGVDEAEATAAIAAGEATEIRVNHECGCALTADGTVFSGLGSCEAHASAPRWKEKG